MYIYLNIKLPWVGRLLSVFAWNCRESLAIAVEQRDPVFRCVSTLVQPFIFNFSIFLFYFFNCSTRLSSWRWSGSRRSQCCSSMCGNAIHRGEVGAAKATGSPGCWAGPGLPRTRSSWRDMKYPTKGQVSKMRVCQETCASPIRTAPPPWIRLPTYPLTCKIFKKWNVANHLVKLSRATPALRPRPGGPK